MIGVEQRRSGTAGVEGDLWSARSRDWAEIQEGTVLPLYRAVLERCGIAAGKRLLDVGCGAGRFAELAARAGAVVSGIDAAPALVAIARERVPLADVRVGEIEDLPWANASFDVVTGLHAFEYAANPVHALREARRVAAPGASVCVAGWGAPEDCEAAGYLRVLDALQPPGALERLVADASLTPSVRAQVECTWLYPDLDTALRGLLSAGPAVRAMRASGADRVARAVAAAIAPYRGASGGYRIENRFCYVIAR